MNRLSMPWGKEIEIIGLESDGFPMLRLRIREGKRLTDLDLDPKSAAILKEALENWLIKQPS